MPLKIVEEYNPLERPLYISNPVKSRKPNRDRLTQAKDGQPAWRTGLFYDMIVSAYIDTGKVTCIDMLLRFRNHLPNLSPITIMERAVRKVIMRITPQRSGCGRLRTEHVTRVDLNQVYELAALERDDQQIPTAELEFELLPEEEQQAQDRGFFMDTFGFWWMNSA